MGVCSVSAAELIRFRVSGMWLHGGGSLRGAGGGLLGMVRVPVVLVSRGAGASVTRCFVLTGMRL